MQECLGEWNIVGGLYRDVILWRRPQDLVVIRQRNSEEIPDQVRNDVLYGNDGFYWGDSGSGPGMTCYTGMMGSIGEIPGQARNDKWGEFGMSSMIFQCR